jgi:hypothetical protein
MADGTAFKLWWGAKAVLEQNLRKRREAAERRRRARRRTAACAQVGLMDRGVVDKAEESADSGGFARWWQEHKDREARLRARRDDMNAVE